MSFTGGGMSSQLSVTASYQEATAGMGVREVLLIYFDAPGTTHMKKMAASAKRGLETVDGMRVSIYKIPPSGSNNWVKVGEDPYFLPDMAHKVKEGNGLLLGIPGDYGLPPPEMKGFFNSLHALGMNSLVGKPAGVFTSSPMQGAGQETTIWSVVTQLSALGMIFVPTGYGFGPAMFNLKTVQGGSPYGAGTIVGPEIRKTEPSTHELDYAQYQGSYFGLITKRFRN